MIALSAAQINANGTTLSASNTAGGYAGNVVMGATNINTGSGLTTLTDGAFGFQGFDGYGSVIQTSTPAPPVDFLQVQFNGLDLRPITVQGQALTASSDGYQGQVIFNGSNMTLGSSNITLTANSNGSGSAGFVQIYANQITNNSNVLATANGTGGDAGGFVYVRANSPTADLTIGQGKLAVFANGGPAGGNGGEIDIACGHTLSVDTTAISSSALGGNGWGGRVTLVGGTPGFAGGGVTFTNPNASINANGQGAGDGGLVQIGAFGNGSNLTLPSISANGGATGSGGWIDSTINNNLTISGPLSANAGSAGNGSGGTVNTYAGTNGVGSTTGTADISANGAGSGAGGYVSLYTGGNLNIQNSNTPSVSVSAKGGSTGDGGVILLAAGHSTTIYCLQWSCLSDHHHLTGCHLLHSSRLS